MGTLPAARRGTVTAACQPLITTPCTATAGPRPRCHQCTSPMLRRRVYLAAASRNSATGRPCPGRLRCATAGAGRCMQLISLQGYMAGFRSTQRLPQPTNPRSPPGRSPPPPNPPVGRRETCCTATKVMRQQAAPQPPTRRAACPRRRRVACLGHGITAGGGPGQRPPSPRPGWRGWRARCAARGRRTAARTAPCCSCASSRRPRTPGRQRSQTRSRATAASSCPG